MLYMVEFQLKPGCKSKAVEYFEARGPNRTPGVKFHGAWIGKDCEAVFVLLEGDTEAQMKSAGQVWDEFGKYRMVPVMNVLDY